MIKAFKTVFVPRLRELAHHVDSARAQKVFSWAWTAQHVESWLNHANEIVIEAQTEERIAEQRRNAETTKTFAQLLESALEKRIEKLHTDGRP